MRRVGVRCSRSGCRSPTLYPAAAIVLLRLFATAFHGATNLPTTGVVLAATRC
ncbi:hypothetical protein [Salinigranum marinum]|uniref:hypothetical protein n=1 Tax=Salinigranum marinum TaxID=1515595 RepID=UPI002989A784|nr:hypothetical protein [Salinigranum marinum]